MSHSVKFARSISIAIPLLLPAVALADDLDDIVSDQAIVRLLPGQSIETFNSRFGTTVLDAIESRSIYLLQLPDWIDEDQMETLFEEDEHVEWAELNLEDEDGGPDTQSLFFGASVEGYTAQAAWALLGIDTAHGLATGDGAIVAVLDTGINPNHGALAGRVLQGFNALDGTSDTDDVGNGVDDDGDGVTDEAVGHGTFVAGLIVGVAPDALLLPVTIVESDGRATTFRLAKGMFWAIDNGADVINVSLGTTFGSELIEDVVEGAEEAGAVVVAAAGNENVDDPVRYPAGTDDVVAVLATDEVDVKAPFSNYGEHITISSPGVDVVSTIPGDDYAQASGTSFSTAIVSGTFALLLDRAPCAAADDYLTAVYESAAPIEHLNQGFAEMLGAGRVDAIAALLALPPGGGDADLNNDGTIDTLDFLVFLQFWSEANESADFNGDGSIDTSDFIAYLQAFVAGC